MPAVGMPAFSRKVNRTPSEAQGTIVVAGEALFDLVLEPSGALQAHPGGGPFNVARTIGRLAQPVTYLGRLSTDAFGTRLLGILAQDGVGLDALVRTEEPTTLALAELDAHGVASYRFYVRGTSATGLEPAEARQAMPRDVSILQVGTLGLVLEPMADALAEVVAGIGDETLVAVDPNCRPSAIRDADSYRRRLRRILARADLVKVSGEDLEWLDPGRPQLEAARALLAQGPAAILLTRGGDEAVALTAGAETAIPVPHVQVADTIGAGDAFGGGFLAWWRAHRLGRGAVADHALVIQATRYACTVAARTCERPGASPPRLDELSHQEQPDG